ncbi:gluconokinase [Pseudonocardia sp. RS11V-5]|uniref:gluconokinase n=1 Tax=Pseudonocardia terrae TaxID=2905831 RepID=UPI001E60F48C|nr:gluconokinase [Pseudonocardia terrae]MCE3553347.1 gluconokinase [Pseudonocardia terrae]
MKGKTTTLVVMGVSGAGKSTVAEELVRRTGWAFAEGDALHPEENRRKMAAGHPLTDEDRWPWLRRVADWIGEQEAAGRDAVVTCSALRRRYRDVLVDGHPSVRFVHLRASTDALASRLAVRQGHYMPPSLLDSQLGTLEPLEPGEPGIAVSGEGDPGAVVDRVLAELTPAGGAS